MSLENKFKELEKYIQNCANTVEDELDTILTSPNISNRVHLLHEAVRYSVLSGGKRLRPFLLIASSDLLGVSRSLSIKYAAIIEMIHCYSLIHDDLPAIDNDDIRRGKPTCHKKFGEAIAILAGDCLLTKAFELASFNINISPVLQLNIINKIAQMIGDEGLIGGQVMDLANDENKTYQDIMIMNNMKTGALFKLCSEIAYMLSNSNSQQTYHYITMYAKSIGCAFQIIDDIKDYKADNAKNKKSSVSREILDENSFEKAFSLVNVLINQAISMLSNFDQKKSFMLIEFARYIHEEIK